MSKENSGYVPLLEVNTSPSQTFVSAYDGPFASRLGLHLGVVERYLDIASLHQGSDQGRVLLTSKYTSPVRAAPDLNPDGSVSAKGGLRWGERLPDLSRVRTQQEKEYRVIPDEQGWVVEVRGEQIHQGLLDKHQGNARRAEQAFAGVFSDKLQNGLRDIVLREKLTDQKDSEIKFKYTLLGFDGYLVGTGLKDVFTDSLLSAGIIISAYLLSKVSSNLYYEKRRMLYPDQSIFSGRLSLKSPLEYIRGQLEWDRALLAWGYLESQKLRRRPIAKFINE